MTSSTPLPESAVLARRDPAITDSDDWPEFRLQDAVVTLPDTDDSTPVSLLVASENYPLTVTGRLAPPGAEQEHLWLRNDGGKKGTSIVVEDVRSFAYGAYEDGSVEIWAAGKAGWFVLQPGRAYRTIYEEMCDAVKMLFFVVDAYTEPVRKKKGGQVQEWLAPKAEQVFELYARDELGDEARLAEAAEAVCRHRDFLLSSMLAGKEGIAWSKNPLFRHLSRKFADDLRAIRERSAPPAPEEKAQPRRVRRQASIDSASTSSSLKRKRDRPPKYGLADVTSMKQDLLQRTAPARPETQRAKHALKPAPTRRTRLNSRSIPRSTAPEVEESATPGEESDSDDGRRPRKAGKGKSALRPKPSKPMKGPSKGLSKGNAPISDDDGGGGGDESRSYPILFKRDRQQQSRRGTKRRHNKSEVDEGIDIPTSPSSPSDTEPGAIDPNTNTLHPGRPEHPTLSDSLSAHRPDPLQEHTWLCALDGCTHKIYGAPSDPTSQRLIREHYALHAYDDDERVRLVKRLQAPSLPVGHLMERVKVAAKGEGFPGSRVAGTRFPEPLGTRY